MYKIKKENTYLFAFIIFLAIISLLIIKNFIIQIMFTGILVYLFQPLYNKLIRYVHSHFIVSIFMIFLILIILILPAGLIVWNFTSEISKLENSNIQETLDFYSTIINDKFSTNINLANDYELLLIDTNNFLKNSIILQIPKFIFNLFVIMFLFYYFLKNSKEENEYLHYILQKRKVKKFVAKISILLEGIVFGQMLVRFIQAILGGFLFFLIGIDGFVILGFLMFFAAFIPIFGTSLIWGPLLLINLINQNYELSLYLVIIGIIVSTVDNFLLPYFISVKTNIGPVTTLLSIIGGLQLFGIYGIILGPFFLGLFFVFAQELFDVVRNDSPLIKRYIWNKNERKKFNNLKSNVAKKEFVRILNQKYELEEFKGKDVKYRYHANNKYEENERMNEK